MELKKSTTEITKDVYDTVCSFSNRDGGHIFLGVRDDGTILGIRLDCVDRMKKDFVTSVNNENKMYPPLYLSPIEYEYEYEEKIIPGVLCPTKSFSAVQD